MLLYQDQCQRGRDDGEVVALLREGLAGRAPAPATSRRSTANSSPSTRALARLAEGDLCLILIDQVDEALAHIAKRVAEA